MKILVAGSTGLVGKTLISDFLQEHEVIAISRRPFKFPNNVKQELIDFNKDFSLKPADHFFICLGYPLELLDLIYMRDKIKPKFEDVDFSLIRCKTISEQFKFISMTKFIATALAC